MLRTEGGDTVEEIEAREIAMPLFRAANVLRKVGADPLVSDLSNGEEEKKEELKAALRSVWRSEVYGAPVPMKPNTALQIAVSMFEEWARLTGKKSRIGKYRKAVANMVHHRVPACAGTTL